MPHGVFTFITLADGGKLNVEGKLEDSDHGHPRPTAIQIAVMAANDREKRIDCVPISIGPTWQSLPPNETPKGPFAKDELVIVVGAATHSDDDFPKPFVWPGIFQVGAEGSRHGEVHVVVEC